ncbi:hypothetical protein [Desulfobulbus propionicus]|nr:hypothetical protein [Desulfobulbus propionicus]
MNRRIQGCAQAMLAAAATCSLLMATEALAELSVRDRCEQALKMMGVKTDGTERGWASLCAGVIKNEPITRYGNWYGPGYWGGGEDPHRAGLAAPVDSLDAVAMRHDFGYVIAEKYGKIYGKQYEYKLKAMADRVAVRDALKLPEDPRKWPQVPKDIEAASRYRDRIITGFIIESDIYKNLAGATKVGDAITSPFITMFDQIDYSHVPDLAKFDREVASHINGWKKQVAQKAAEDKKLKEAAEKASLQQGEAEQQAAEKEQAEKERAARKAKEAKEAKEAQEARTRLEEKIKASKQEPKAPPVKRKSYEEMTPEERHEALKNNYPEAWKGLRNALVGEDKAAAEEILEEEEQVEAETSQEEKAEVEIQPVRVTASGSFDEDHSSGGFANIVTTTITVSFWNVGNQVPGYGEASMKTSSVSSLNGATSESSCGGTFSGGPNGVLRFSGECDGVSLSLRGGSTISAEGVSLTVSNPSAFSDWEQ